MPSLDYGRAAAFIAAVPDGCWTSYKDVAIAAGNPKAAMPIGGWLRQSGGSIPNYWRVIRSNGSIPDGFVAHAPDRPGDPGSARERLMSEDVVFTGNGRAVPSQHFRVSNWQPPSTQPASMSVATVPTRVGRARGGRQLDSPVGPAVRPPGKAPAARAAHLAPALPGAIAHADWGTAVAKRMVATAELGRDGLYVAHKARVVGEAGSLCERLCVAGSAKTALLGFDFPIGVPRAYAGRAGIENFATWLRGLDSAAPLFTVASDINDVSIERPFFPQSLTEKTPGLKNGFRAALGLTSEESLRRCDLAHTGRGAASEMFWTLGPKAVGKATLAGWRDAIKPALADRRARYAIWPFDGPLSELVETFDAVIVETYPAEFYRRLGLRIGTAGHSKTSPEARQATASALLAWCTEHGIVPDDDLAGQILDGFGAGKAGEDPFDAVVGLLGMVATIRGASEPELPDDPAIRQVEGWMFGQPVPSPLDPTPAPQADAAAKPQISSKRVALPDPELVTEPRGDVARRVTAEHLDGIVVGEDGVARCWWAEFSPAARSYHDEEWGVPHDSDQLLFDQLSFQVIQGGVSWVMVLNKRDGLRRAFAGFDFEQVARFDETGIARLLADPGIVRSRQKIEAVIHDARCTLKLVQDEGSLARFVWRFEPEPTDGGWDRVAMETITEIPESRALARALKHHGWRFVGPYSMYLFMQAAGLINHHVDGCARREQITVARADFTRP